MMPVFYGRQLNVCLRRPRFGANKCLYELVKLLAQGAKSPPWRAFVRSTPHQGRPRADPRNHRRDVNPRERTPRLRVRQPSAFPPPRRNLSPAIAETTGLLSLRHGSENWRKLEGCATAGIACSFSSVLLHDRCAFDMPRPHRCSRYARLEHFEDSHVASQWLGSDGARDADLR